MANVDRISADFSLNNQVKLPSKNQPNIAGYDNWMTKQTKLSNSTDGGNFLSKIPSGMGSAAGTAIAGLGNAYGQEKWGDSFSEDEMSSQASIRKGLEAIPVWGQIISAASGVVDAAGSATGLNLASVDKDSAERAGISGTGFNKAMNMLPGNSMIWGGISALAGYDRTHGFKVDKDIASMTDGYGSILADLNAAESLGNKRLMFGQTDQANRFVDSAKNKQEMLKSINTVNTQRKQSDYYQDLQNQNLNRYAGQNYLGMIVGRNGMKLMSVEEAKRIIALRKEAETEDVEKLQNGGNIPGINTSILPEGALHKNKNHLDEINPDLEDATKKGIPVMAAEGGEITDQVAEIEHSEIIFRLEVTKRLEELMKDGSEEAMIEAGKLVTEEVIENTVDNTGQITNQENGDTDSSNK